MTITTIAECQRGQRATWNAELDKRAVDAAAATTVAANDKVPSAEWETTSSMKERDWETERGRGGRVEVAESGAWPDEATERKLFGTAENAELWATGDNNNNNSNNK